MNQRPTSESPSFSQIPPGAWRPLYLLSRWATRPVERFLHIQAASGILLILAAAVALLWANSPWAETYTIFWQTPVGLRIGDLTFERSLEWIVNDGLMVIFFFVVGLEIRREIYKGELSEWRRAALPVAAAIGGMLAPAAIYLFTIDGPSLRSGWGVPMATDIAFAVGVLTLLGPRVPAALRVLLLAVAVIDDLGAIIVIALFYSSHFAASGLLIAALGFGGIYLMQWLGVRSKSLYIVPSVIAWAGIYATGVHPTIAGVIIGFVTPVKAWLGTEGFIDVVSRKLDHLTGRPPESLPDAEMAETLNDMAKARREALSPAESLIATLHPWVAFGIMPVFALANAGVRLSSGLSGEGATQVALAVALGLLLGKPLGVITSSWLAVRLRIGVLPLGLTLRHLSVLGVVASIGFTMALFIAQLAFADPALLAAAKLGILVSSVFAGLLGLFLGRIFLPAHAIEGSAKTADEAEASTLR